MKLTPPNRRRLVVAIIVGDVVLLAIGAGIGFTLGDAARRPARFAALLGLAALGLPMFAAMGWLQRCAARGDGPAWVRWFTTPAGRIVRALAIAVLALVLMDALKCAMTSRGGSHLASIARDLWMAPMFFGFSLLSGVGDRVGDAPHCGACGYDLSGQPDGDEARADDRCPECGGLFRRDGMVRGRRRPSLPWVLAGGAFVIASWASMLVPLAFSRAGLNWYVRYLPTGSLIAEVTNAPRGFTTNEWAALARRTLTPAQEQRLALGLIDLRLRQGHQAREAESWLEKLALAGRMSAPLRERYFAEMVEPVLDLPRDVRAGEPIRAALEVRFRGNIGFPLSSTLDSKLLFGGFRVGDEPEVRGRSDSWEPAITAIRTRVISPWQAIGAEPAGEAPSARSRPPADTVRVGATVWVIVSPAGKGFPEAVWKADGTPVIPADAVWSGCFELEGRVIVRP